MFRLENMQSTFLGTFLPCEDQTKRVIRDCGGAAMQRVTMIDWSQQESSPSTQSCLPFSPRPITVSRAKLPDTPQPTFGGVFCLNSKQR